MSGSNVGGKKTGGRRDRFRRLFGIRPRSSPSIASDTITGASTSGHNSTPQPREPIQGTTTPKPVGDPSADLVVPAADPVAHDPALPLPSPGLDASLAPQVVAAPDKSEAGSLWARAMNSLSEKDRNTLSSLSDRDENTPGATATRSTLDIEELLVAVRVKREMSLRSQWEFEFRGRAVNLRDQADKIISWLAKFKEVGDIAIQQDPTHAALPWAGIRFLLQMAIAERDQMELLLTEVERLTNITSRCRIYEILYLDGTQSKKTEDEIKPAFEHLSTSLVLLYTAVLQFLAKAYRAFDKSGIRRAQVATFNPGMFEGFTKLFQDLDAEVIAAVGNCKEACDRNAHRDMGRLFEILKDLEEPVQRIDSGVKALLQNVGAKRRTKILRWISAIPYEDNHNTAFMGHTSGTGEWLLQHDTYIEWRTSPTCNVLWLHGIPGAGKTKLVSTVVGSLRRALEKGSQAEALAYFYCDRNQPDRRSIDQIMKSFVRQLSTPRDSDMIPSCIGRCYAEKEKPGFASVGLTFQECCALVRELVREYTKVTLVLDALDECDRETRHKLVNEIDQLVSNPTSCIIKVFISSRPDKDIKHRFQVGPNVCISATDNGEDIKKFIVDTINNSPPDWREDVASTPGLQEEIVTTLHEKANGMFQWAKLQMDQLLRLLFVSDIRGFLGKLPKDLKKAYDEIMDQIDSQEGRTPEIARRAFLWVMCSSEPLRPGMLAHAVCQDPGTRATNPGGININVVLEACRNLVMVDQSGVCRFSHLSVQEYLEDCRYSNHQAHLMVGSVCLHMLLDPTNWQSVGSMIFDYGDPWKDEGILRYTVVYWPAHARLHAAQHVDDRLQLLLKEFLGSPKEGSSAYRYWSHAMLEYCSAQGGPSFCEGFSESSIPAFAVAIFGLNQILSDWWTSSFDVDLQDNKEQSLLYITGLNGNLAAAAELLDLGADPNIQGGFYGNPLQAAAQRGNIAIVRLLLNRGADVNTQGGKYGNALQAAASEDNEAIVHLLLDRGANISAQGGEYGNALQAAALEGSEATICLLLDRGADINAKGGQYGNALQAAASKGGEATICLLLDRGADINAQGGKHGNALQAAALNGTEAAVHLLLDRGADINAKGGTYGSALQAAASKGSEAIVCLLLDRGADINAGGGIYGNALQAAVRKNSEVTVRLLLDRGADVNALGGEFGSALQAAAWGGYEAIVHLLLGRGADVNAQGGKFGNALQAAALSGSVAIVRLLLDREADVNAQGGRYGNALQAAACRSNEAIPRLLVDRGADTNAQGGEYGSALQAAACGGTEATVRLLLDQGADINAQGGQFGNALQAAALRPEDTEAIVRLLLDRGADINAQGGEYGNALQAAMWWGSEATARLLLDRGADINAQGGKYGNALQAAANGCSEIMVHHLLDRGADIHHQGGEYGNVLQAAARRGNEATVRLLLDRGADVNFQGGKYGNALQAAVHWSRNPIVRLLLDYGADANSLQGHYRAMCPRLEDISSE